MKFNVRCWLAPNPKTIIFSGVGKTRAEMRFALETGIGCFNVESLPELDTLNAVALNGAPHKHPRQP